MKSKHMLHNFFGKISLVGLIIGFSASEQIFAAENNSETLTHIWSEGNGRVAVRIEVPISTRYPEGAPIVVEASTWFVDQVEFHRRNDTRKIGAVTVSYIWPGRKDYHRDIASDGVFDHGGPFSLLAFRDVIQFAAGMRPDIDGHYMQDLLNFSVLYENLGIFASSHAGVVATNMLAHHGSYLPGVKYLIGRENPTRDEMYPLELGHFDDQDRPVHNPFFNESHYSTTEVIVDYSTVGWYQVHPDSTGRPYFAEKEPLPEHILHPEICPKMWGKRYYSRAITRALLENGALTLDQWPEDLATPAETEAAWPFRICIHNYPAFLVEAPDLKVMLVFSQDDHVQTAPTKPHIHQAWDGFHKTANLWTRMNPDRAYLKSINPDYGSGFPDNPANQEPLDWINIRDWGFPAEMGTRQDVWLASCAEMADRIKANDWSNNLDSVFFPTLVGTTDTNVYKRNETPKDCILFPNHPNPFNPTTYLNYQLNRSSFVILSIYNIRGVKIATLVNAYQMPGSYRLRFHRDGLPSGVYFYELKTDRSIQREKMLIAK